LFERAPAALVFTSLGVISLYAGYRRRGTLLPYASGLLLYVPVAVALSAIAGPVEGSLAAGTGMILGSERMSFENDLSRILEASTGVDSESSLLASRLSAVHLRRLGVLTSLVVLVAIASLPMAGVAFYVPVLVSSSTILLLIVYAYSRGQQ